jgi:hypothetical protein
VSPGVKHWLQTLQPCHCQCKRLCLILESRTLNMQEWLTCVPWCQRSVLNSAAVPPSVQRAVPNS